MLLAKQNDMAANEVNTSILTKALDGVEGWLAIDDAVWLARYVARVAARDANPVIVEIGSWKGRSTIAMALALRRAGRGTLFAIDPHLGVSSSPSDTMPEFLSNLNNAGVADLVEPIRTFSREPLERFADRSVSFLFLDGSHDYDEVVRDIAAWEPKMAENAVIAFDDADWPGVNQAIREHLTRYGTPFRRPRFHSRILYSEVARTRPWSIADGIALLRLPLFLRALLIYARISPRMNWRLRALTHGALRAFLNVPLRDLPRRLGVFLLLDPACQVINAAT